MSDYVKAEIERKQAKLLEIRRRKALESLQQTKESEEVAQKLSSKENESEAIERFEQKGGLEIEKLLEELGLETSDAVLKSREDHLKRGPRLTISNVQQTNVPPKECISYNKHVQTSRTIIKIKEPISNHDLKKEDVERMPQVEWVKPVATAADEAAMATEPAEEKLYNEPPEMDEEERLKVMSSESFLKFFQNSSKVIEKALGENWDVIFVDYDGTADEEFGNGDESSNGLKMNRNFYDEKWCGERVVTSLNWSTHFPELLAASYGKNENSFLDPDGVAAIWNLNVKKTLPEHLFHCQSAVTSTTFDPFHPHLLLGGTYSGQIVVWDSRVGKRTPVQKNSISVQGHTHPIHCIKVVGSQNAHNLVSISSDGKFCSWSLDMLSHPQETMKLSSKQVIPYLSVSATSFSFPIGDVNNFIVGSEESNVYLAHRQGSQAGVKEIFKGHKGPVTAVDTHRVQGLDVDCSSLFLTSSFDWTVKLWSVEENNPLFSFEDFGDYVTDVGWSPIHPALFANVDGSGRLDVWNLNNNVNAPMSSTIVDGSPVLSKLAWSHSGYQLAVGDAVGKLWVYDVGEQLATPKTNESAQLASTLLELKNDRTDEFIRKL